MVRREDEHRYRPGVCGGMSEVGRPDHQGDLTAFILLLAIG